MSTIICAKCNGYGYIPHYETDRAWSEVCKCCNGRGAFGDIIISEDIVIDEDMVYITKAEYNELLEYKSMYEKLCT